MLSVSELKDGLAQFYGTEKYYRWSKLYPKFFLTDGAWWLANNAECFWLMDLIGSWQYNKKVHREYFQVWKLMYFKGSDPEYPPLTIGNVLEIKHSQPVPPFWMAVCEDGNGRIIAEQKIEYSDFPLYDFKLYAIYTGDEMVILLPSEY